MKRSKVVVLTLVPAVASWFAACGPSRPEPQTLQATHQQVCVDGERRVVDSRECDSQTRRSSTGVSPFLWYFIGRASAGAYPVGAYAPGGGTYAPPPNAVVSRGNTFSPTVRSVPSGAAFGGFGSTASGTAGS